MVISIFILKSLRSQKLVRIPLNEPNHIQPGRCFRSHTGTGTCTDTFSLHVAKPSPALCDRSVVVRAGRALGGGSSMNGMKTIFVINAQTDVD